MNDAERFWAKVDKSGECWEWTGGLSNGYGRIRLGGRTGKQILTHRLSYIWKHPLTIDLLEHPDICVCHRCDNPKCVNPSHLFLGSQHDNHNDMVLKGRIADKRGEKHHLAKLTEHDVREIRTRYANGGITQNKLALEYGVNNSTLNRIILRGRWSHIAPMSSSGISTTSGGSLE